MQLNKVLKGLMLALPVLAVAACSSNKNDQADAGTVDNGANAGMSAEELARQQAAGTSEQQYRILRFRQIRYLS